MSRHSAVKVTNNRQASPGVSRAVSQVAADKVRIKGTAIANADLPISILDSRLKKAARSAFHLMGED